MERFDECVGRPSRFKRWWYGYSSDFGRWFGRGFEWRLRSENEKQTIEAQFLAGGLRDEQMPDVHGIKRTAKQANTFHGVELIMKRKQAASRKGTSR